MFFIFRDKFGRREVIGGAVSVDSAKRVAERRAKQVLDWKISGDKFVSEVSHGNYSEVYSVERGKEDA